MSEVKALRTEMDLLAGSSPQEKQDSQKFMKIGRWITHRLAIAGVGVFIITTVADKLGFDTRSFAPHIWDILKLFTP